MGDNIFVQDEPNPEKVERAVRERATIPPEYKKFVLSSNGKLNVPRELHFKDYNFDDALKIGMTDEENILENLIFVLNRCVFEKVDCADLHESEMEEILLNMFFNYWGKTIEKAYPYEREELEFVKKNNPERYKLILSGKETPIIELSAQNVSDFNYLPEIFKEPIVIGDNIGKNKFKFTLPRLKHLLLAKEHSEQKFVKDQFRFAKLEEDIRYNQKIDEEKLAPLSKREIDSEEFTSYTKMTQDKLNDFLMVRQALLISGMNDKVCNTLAEKLEVYPKIGLHIWQVYNSVVEKYQFGIKKDIQVKSPLTGEVVTRTFPFQLVDFLPSNDLHDSDGYDVSFGD